MIVKMYSPARLALTDYSKMETAEIWKPVIDWNDFYEASSLGRIRNIQARRGTHAGKILKGRPSKDGYLKVVLQHDGHKKSVFVHRVVHEAFFGAIKPDQEIDHLDFNRANNVLSNLEAVSRQVNIDRSFKKGRDMARGSRQGRSVFTEEQVASILLRVAQGEKQKDLAAEFNVTPTAINCMVKGKTWRHVSPQSAGKIGAS